MEQVKLICEDHNFKEVGLFCHVVNSQIEDLPMVNPFEDHPNLKVA